MKINTINKEEIETARLEKEAFDKINQEEGFVTQLGTVLVKKDEFKDVLLEPTPIVDENYIVKNQKGEPFCLVHQYDRASHQLSF